MTVQSPAGDRRPNRRAFLVLLLSSVAIAPSRPARTGPLDQGIGGTGAAPPTEENDRGLGGTGVIGTIRKFGSIIVNDMRIAYPQDADVRIDGAPATPADLKLGQVVRVVAHGEPGAFQTRTIDVTSEVVGPVDKTARRQIIVLGQTIATGRLKTGGLKRGDVVAVSGLRRNDGTIVASLIERSDGAPSRIAGPLTQSGDGRLRIGALPVAGIDPALAGHRVVVVGNLRDGAFLAARSATETSLLPASVRTLSIESYVERHGDGLRLGSGYDVVGNRGFDVPAGRSLRAVVETQREADGRLTIDSIRAGGRTYGPAGGGARRSGPGPKGGGSQGGEGRGPGQGGRGESGPAGGRRPTTFDRGGADPGGRFGGPGNGAGGGGFGGPGGPAGGFGGQGGFGSGPGGGFGGPGGGFGGGRR